METEANYFDVLNALKYKFMQPMEKLLKDEIKTIFPRIKVKVFDGIFTMRLWEFIHLLSFSS